jgi:hypothetical protein
MPHISIVDFIVWPAFREYVVQIPEMQERMEYMLDLCKSIRCDWYFPIDEALQRNEETGLMDLCDLAKVCAPCQLHMHTKHLVLCDLLTMSDNNKRPD